MDSVQRQLSEYLQCELYHSLGAYRVAGERLGELETQLEESQGGMGLDASEENRATDRGELKSLLELVRLSRRHNRDLSEHRYSSTPMRGFGSTGGGESDSGRWPARDPVPHLLPLTRKERFDLDPGDAAAQRKDPLPPHPAWETVLKYYREGIGVLSGYDANRQAMGGLALLEYKFAESLATPRDGVSAGGKRQNWDRRRERRLERYRHRYLAAREHLVPREHEQPPADPEEYERHPGFMRRITCSDLSTAGQSLPLLVVNVLAEAHLSMHAVEAWHAMCLADRAESLGRAERRWLNEELERSIVLFTFVYSISRTAPWIFAKDQAEREGIFIDCSTAWENVVPAHCMWIAAQMGLLALHRRAYARSLQEEAEQSYNDYHKLQQVIRDTERRISLAPIHVDGAPEFLAGLGAEAHHQVGELYRSEHAYKPALEHFEAASHRLGRLRKEGKVGLVLVDSRWQVQLQVSRGKACYEMGRHKEALNWYLNAWRAFLELLAAETRTETSMEAIEKACDWLESVKFSPDLRKSEISERIRPVVDQLDRISPIGPLGALGAEVLLRLGHLLFVLNVGHGSGVENIEAHVEEPDLVDDEVRQSLAFNCLRKAAECDPHSTLIGADLLKARFRFASQFGGKLPDRYSEKLDPPPLKPIGEHWPRGGDDYERLGRVAEYLILEARRDRFEDQPPNGEDFDATDAFVARDLLLSLFMSTDSINVRKSQIHHFLTRCTPGKPLPGKHPAPAIEFVCMRRYSSPFPLLARPSAFRALGGGYFLRLHTKSGEGEQPMRAPFGVVVDPGVDFVENLYRAGYSLADIDMIVVTHDHVDHLGALEPLLSLLHVRSQLLMHESDRSAEAKRIRVLVSKSVLRRYGNVKQLHASKKFEFGCLEKMMDHDGVLQRDTEKARQFLDNFPSAFEIVAMSSEAGGVGHLDLSGRPSFGICLRVAGEVSPSVAMTSDTPPPPKQEDGAHENWRRVWGPALTADVLVVHLGSVPLPELRRMDRDADDGDGAMTSAPRSPALKDDEGMLENIRDRLQQADDDLQGQVEYAQWLRSHKPAGDEVAVTAPLVGAVPSQWLPPPDHSYLAGLLAWAREYRAAREELAGPVEKQASPDCGTGKPPGLFVIGELSEELATMRGKVATRLNQHIFPGDSIGALTADIGLHICVTTDPTSARHTGAEAKVLCTTCDLDTDRAPDERYHLPGEVHEVCVKGENEGIFYNCSEHDPASQEDPKFLERLERFDIFGR